MFVVNEDMSIYCTRGDSGTVYVTAEKDGLDRVFKAQEVVRFKVFEKKGCDCVVLQKDVVVGADTVMVPIYLSGVLTKIGGIIHKPVDYWYEVELNPLTTPETIVGYDDDGAKVFRLYPEGKDVEDFPSGTLPEGEVNDIIAEALARAHASGAFTGAPGKDGEDGEDGEDGKTPVKGVDYFTEVDKAEMVQEVLYDMPFYGGDTDDPSTGGTPSGGHVLTEADIDTIADRAAKKVNVPVKLPNPHAITFNGAVSATYDGSAGVTIEIPEGASGEQVAQAVSKYMAENMVEGGYVLHDWNGTTLTITTASGSSSMDLKGEKGDPGQDGRTPVKGTDYYTEAEKTEIVQEVLAAMPYYTGETEDIT